MTGKKIPWNICIATQVPPQGIYEDFKALLPILISTSTNRIPLETTFLKVPLSSWHAKHRDPVLFYVQLLLFSFFSPFSRRGWLITCCHNGGCTSALGCLLVVNSWLLLMANGCHQIELHCSATILNSSSSRFWYVLKHPCFLLVFDKVASHLGILTPLFAKSVVRHLLNPKRVIPVGHSDIVNDPAFFPCKLNPFLWWHYVLLVLR